MSRFSQYPFEASYIKSYNLINHGEAKYNLYTESGKASRILAGWKQEVHKFVKVIPKQYKEILLHKQKIEINREI